MESVDQIAASDSHHEGASDPDLSPAPAPWHFWRALLASIAVYEGLIWVLDAIPTRVGEPLVLRWLRALGEHPLRGPLGLTLAWLGVVQLLRAALNRPTRA